MFNANRLCKVFRQIRYKCEILPIIIDGKLTTKVCIYIIDAVVDMDACSALSAHAVLLETVTNSV
jgi:hypothetical protein